MAREVLGFVDNESDSEKQEPVRNTESGKAAPAKGYAKTKKGNDPAVPAMKVNPKTNQEHRERIVPDALLQFDCAVARKVRRDKVSRVPEASAAVDKEWNKLAQTPTVKGRAFGT